MLGKRIRTGIVALVAGCFAASAQANPDWWSAEWPNTDFKNHSVAFEEIRSGGPPKDGIPSIDDPKFEVADKIKAVADNEPVIGFGVGDDMRAYPLAVLMWHEIVNDTVGGVPVSVTYCPLCNAAVVFDRRVDGQVLDFGTTGKLRNSDLVMYDRQTESWWQQFTGTAIVGEMTGTELKMLPARLESFANFKARAPEGKVLIPNNPGLRRYGVTPYAGYDGSTQPFLYNGKMPDNVPPLSRVVKVGDRAWALPLVRSRKRIETEDGLIISWTPGQSSAMDHPVIAEGSDVGNVIVQRMGENGLEDVPYGVDYAFAFHAFYPDSEIIAK